MGMDGIGGVGALNVSSQTRVTRPQSETVDVNTGSTAGQQQVQVASLPPIGGKGNSNNNGQPGQQQDRGAVQTDQEVAPDKIKAEIGWEPETMFKDGIRLTIKWFFEHEDWMKNVTSGDYQKYYEDMYAGK